MFTRFHESEEMKIGDSQREEGRVFVDSCPFCGVSVGTPHKPGCVDEVCTICAEPKMMCDCKGHDPNKAAWAGEWWDAEQVQRLKTAVPFEEPCYPGFVPDQRDMEQLALSYLDEAVRLHCFSFFTGCCEGRRADLRHDRFERVAGHLGEEKRREIIDAVDRYMARDKGDEWQVFKYTCRPGFWSTPAKFDAVVRVAESFPEVLPPEEEDKYGGEYLRTLEAVRERKGIGEHGTDWITGGF